MSLLSVFLGKEVCAMPMWPGCDFFGQFDCSIPADVAEPLLDKHATAFLKEDLPAGFQCIGVPGDGNCLTHAVSKAVIGTELLYHALRLEIQAELRNNVEWYQKHVFPFYDSESATMILMEAAEQAVPKDDVAPDTFQMAEYLGPPHIHAIANVLRRPVVLLAAKNMWEGSLSGVYLPSRRGGVEWGEAEKQCVKSALDALLQELGEEEPNKCGQLNEWWQSVNEIAFQDPAASATLGGCSTALKAIMSGDNNPDRFARLVEAVGLARMRTPIFIAWSNPTLNHYCCVVPPTQEGECSEFDRDLLPWNDQGMIVYGFDDEGNNLTEAEANKFLETSGRWENRANLWPKMNEFVAKIEDSWRAENPGESLTDASVEQGWNILLPNLMSQVLDVAQLFKSLNVDDPEADPEWIYAGSTRLLVPKKIARMAYRLPGLNDLLSMSANRMRPIWITQPDEGSTLMVGKDFDILWGSLPHISRMVTKVTGKELEDQTVEIGWMRAGTGNFVANIAKEAPFALRKFTWSVPADFQPGKYWIAVRLLPFTETQMEGAGPPAFSFSVVADPEVPAPEAAVADVDGWEVMINGQWQDMDGIFPGAGNLLTQEYQKGNQEAVLRAKSNLFVHIDFEQMKVHIRGFALRLRRKNQKFKVDEDALAEMLSMGFDEAACTQALQDMDNDMQSAIMWVLENPEAAAAVELPAPADALAEAPDELSSLLGDMSLDELNSKPGTPVSAVDSSSIKTWTAEMDTVMDERYLEMLEHQAGQWRQRWEEMQQPVEEAPENSLQRTLSARPGDKDGKPDTKIFVRANSAPAALVGASPQAWEATLASLAALAK
eukprot:TRINITY_DN2183_c0_g1_i12.p1 TRINITY_DN2183_c0_g1~~TRINITY_DN2183_c0_g1_i12.p1  ORF type:complete len:832 (-),score=225.33 TRINITY_DN2183_c0_g1_i12:357-2852(-)